MEVYTELLPERKSSRRSVVRWTPAPEELGPVAGFLVIQTGRDSTTYRLEEFPVSWPGRGFRLVKLTTGTDPESYSVFCSRRGPEADSCECHGCERWGTCKHKDATRALVSNGWL